MTDQEKAKILEVAKEAFFEAMLDGYAGGENRKSIKAKTSDGYTTITYITEDGKYKVVDRYCTTFHSDKSAGTTTIFHECSTWVPIWWMSYGGRYPQKAIPFLKKALRQTYKKEEFCGGRGPDLFVKDSLEYHNVWNGDFTKFQGCEEIFVRLMTTELVGFHAYSGMSLL